MNRGGCAILVLLIVTAAGCSQYEAPAEGKISAAATIFPLADVVAQVGGERVSVTTLVPPGVSPHVFEITRRTRQALAEAKLVVSAGRTDAWLSQRMIGAGALHIRLEELAGDEAHDHDDADHSHHHNHDHYTHHDHDDPHYWLDPRNMAALAEAVGQSLAALDPEHAEEYVRRASEYSAQCLALAEEMRAAAEGFRHKAFIAEHPAYGLMAEVMGLEQVASVQPVAGASATPRHIEQLVGQIIERDIPVIFTEPQLRGADARVIQAAAAERGRQVKILTLDPIGNPAVEGRGSYLENMRANLAAMKEGLGG